MVKKSVIVIDTKGRVRLPNQMNFWKSAKGGGVIFNPKLYIADFGKFKQGFLSMKLIQKSNFRVQSFQRLHCITIVLHLSLGCTPRPDPGGNGCPGAPRPRKFSTLPRPAPEKEGAAPPRPENYPGARIVANVPTSSKVFGSQKLLTSIFSTKGALRRHVTYNNHPNLT